MWGMKYALFPLAAAVALWCQPAQSSSLSVCADSGASASEVAHHCKLSLKSGGLSDRQTVAVYVNLGYAELALGQTGQAVESFTEATRLDPRQVEAYIGRAKAYEDRRAFDAADRDLKSGGGPRPRRARVSLVSLRSRSSFWACWSCGPVVTCGSLWTCRSCCAIVTCGTMWTCRARCTCYAGETSCTLCH